MTAIYSAPFDAIAVTTATDLFHVTVTADAPVLIHELDLCQTTDLGDAQEEVLRIGIYIGVTGGSGGTALTEVKYASQDEAAVTAAVLAVNSSASTAGTLLGILGWNIRVPLEKVWTPETRIRCDSAEDPIVFRLLTAPADSITISGTLIWEEL
jgi:uncharacterized protein (DUF849 family)